jgi:hypothetical protein
MRAGIRGWGRRRASPDERNRVPYKARSGYFQYAFLRDPRLASAPRLDRVT